MDGFKYKTVSELDRWSPDQGVYERSEDDYPQPMQDVVEFPY